MSRSHPNDPIKIIGLAIVGVVVVPAIAVALAFGCNLLGTHDDKMWEDAVGAALIFFALALVGAMILVGVVLADDGWFQTRRVP